MAPVLGGGAELNEPETVPAVRDARLEKAYVYRQMAAGKIEAQDRRGCLRSACGLVARMRR